MSLQLEQLWYTPQHDTSVLLQAYVSHVSPYIELMGIFTVRYLKSLLSVLFEYMEYPDYCGEETRMISLKTLCCLMKYTWPRLVEWMNE